MSIKKKILATLAVGMIMSFPNTVFPAGEKSIGNTMGDGLDGGPTAANTMSKEAVESLEGQAASSESFNYASIGIQLVGSMLSKNVSFQGAFIPTSAGTVGCVANNYNPEIGDKVVMTCHAIPAPGWLPVQPVSVVYLSSDKSGVTSGMGTPMVLKKYHGGDDPWWEFAYGTVKGSAHFYDGAATMSDSAEYIDNADFNMKYGNGESSDYSNLSDYSGVSYGGSDAFGNSSYGTGGDYGFGNGFGGDGGWLAEDGDLDSLLSADDNWASIESLSDLELDGDTTFDGNGSVTEDLLGYETDMEIAMTDASDFEGSDYDGSDGNYDGNIYDSMNGDGDFNSGEFDYSSWLSNVMGVGGSDLNMFDADGKTANGGSGSLMDTFSSMLNNVLSVGEDLDIERSTQDLWNESQKLLLASGFELDDLLSGKNYAKNSAYTEPKTAWDMNRITKLLKNKKIEIKKDEKAKNQQKKDNQNKMFFGK